MLFPQEFEETAIVLSSNGGEVLHYDYAIQRTRDTNGMPYGTGSGGVLTVDIKIGTNIKTGEYYEMLWQNEMFYFTLFFNIKFDSDTYKMTSNDGGLVAEGYIIGIDELFNKSTYGELPIMRVKMLINSIDYLKKSSFCNKVV